MMLLLQEERVPTSAPLPPQRGRDLLGGLAAAKEARQSEARKRLCTELTKPSKT
jgi:hypothetical protein